MEIKLPIKLLLAGMNARQYNHCHMSGLYGTGSANILLVRVVFNPTSA